MSALSTVAILGGGFSGAALAVHMARLSAVPLDIRIVEPRPQVGGGLAYSTADPDHRVNGPIDILVLFGDDPGHFGRWYDASGERAGDPDALAQTGQLYCRRSSFGRYMRDLVDVHAAGNASGSTIAHVADRAVDVIPAGDGYRVALESGGAFAADRVFLTVAHEQPAIPGPFRALARHDGFVADPWAAEALARLPDDGDVLILGSALTTADVAATLLRSGRRARITVISRRGLRPREQGVLPPAAERLAKMALKPPGFIRRHGIPDRARISLRRAREEIAELEARGEGWQSAFDDLRDAAPLLWRNLSDHERRRTLRHLRAFYDVHRFRIAPQIAAILRRAEADGRLAFLRARVEAVNAEGGQLAIRYRPRGGDAASSLRVRGVVNCTGPNADIGASGNPLIAALAARGLIRPDPSGAGVDIDDECRAVDRSGTPSDRLRVIGPLTRGHFGDLVAIPHINTQILGVLGALPAR
ncbi:FAD/NAD(P)-binding protein [Oceanibacterium hippocampi]|uniref:FAD-dependent urate hydroxylase HpyO/Asp monooxygenase CreE-like FAD/NAD(P)-binding domain-containing protein n=1 Tax=Oceanibacterium hippocampi TaxID=745714 RepID=A0A1Y5ST78_9PROT|nr:FAD/NAD(P)-binding protein [Oceanibacterium hippocampi]SLN47266.1 hypothetical protein OCH7691_02037 [Oceanibacterium hippocampi]